MLGFVPTRVRRIPCSEEPLPTLEVEHLFCTQPSWSKGSFFLFPILAGNRWFRLWSHLESCEKVDADTWLWQV